MTGRRGTRASSRASTPASDGGGRRSARIAGGSPLPGLAPAASGAYGAPGAVKAPKALAMGGQGFASAFAEAIPELAESSSPLAGDAAGKEASSSPRSFSSGPITPGPLDFAAAGAHSSTISSQELLFVDGPASSSFGAAAMRGHKSGTSAGKALLWAVSALVFVVSLWLAPQYLASGEASNGLVNASAASASSAASAAASAVASVAADVAASIGGTRLRQSGLAPRQADENAYINFFSPGTGAVINPLLSSPSMYHFMAAGDRSKFPLLSDFVASHGAEQALVAFNDLGDSWCTSTMHVPAPSPAHRSALSWGPTSGGAKPASYLHEVKGQLAVSLAHAIFPERAIVESPPRHALLDPAAAPATMSLWVQIEDSKLRKTVWAAVLGVSEDLVLSARPPIDEAPQLRAETWAEYVFGSAWSDLWSPLPSPADLMLDETWVRVGVTEYEEAAAAGGRVDINVDTDMAALGASVKAAVLRVESNLGQQYTCLHRVSLAGKLAL